MELFTGRPDRTRRETHLWYDVSLPLFSAAEQRAHHAAEQATGAAATGTAMIVAAATTGAASAGRTRRRLVIVACGSNAGRKDLGLQRLVLQRVEIAALRITTGGFASG